MSQFLAADARRFLIVRLSAIGDVIHTIPLAAALKRRRPDCFLGWIVEKPASPLIVDNPLLDWVHVVPKGWLKSPGEVHRLRRAAKAMRFDVAFDVQGLSKSAIAARLSGAPVRVGFTRGVGREIAPLLDNRLVVPRGVYVVDNILSLLSAIGDEAPDRPEFVFPPCPPDDKQGIDDYLREKRLTGGYCLMGPWSSLVGKCWPLGRFLELAEGLNAATGLVSLLLGHGKERDAVAAALAGRPGTPVLLAPDVSPAGVVELARHARLFVGCDSFPLHVADGVGCLAAGLFGITNPERVGPRGRNCRSLFAELNLLKTARERRGFDDSVMRKLDVGTVLDACRDMLAKAGADYSRGEGRLA